MNVRGFGVFSGYLDSVITAVQVSVAVPVPCAAHRGRLRAATAQKSRFPAPPRFGLWIDALFLPVFCCVCATVCDFCVM